MIKQIVVPHLVSILMNNEYYEIHVYVLVHYASECGHVQICEMLLDFGADISIKNEYGMTACITAAERTKEDVVKLFCERENLLTKEEIIDAYELIGASFANDKDNYR